MSWFNVPVLSGHADVSPSCAVFGNVVAISAVSGPPIKIVGVIVEPALHQALCTLKLPGMLETLEARLARPGPWN